MRRRNLAGRPAALACAALLAAGLLAACTTSRPAASASGSPTERAGGGPSGTYVVAPGIQIKHVVIVMQENRSFDSYFGTDGRPDPRPDVREDEPILGNLEQDFNFSQARRPPVLLATNPPTDFPSVPVYFRGKAACVGCTVPPPAPGPKSAQQPSKSSQDTDG